MIIIRPSPAFYGQMMHPRSVDAATVHKTACHAANYSACDFPCPQAAKITKQQEASTTAFDSKVVVEKTPLHRHETSEMTVISLDVAGFQSEHLQVEIEDHVLMVSAKRTNKLGDTFVTHRRFALKSDTYDEDSVYANLKDGVLEITIKKKVFPKSRKVPITVALSSTDNKDHENENGSTVARSGVGNAGVAMDEVSSSFNKVHLTEGSYLGQVESEEVASVETVDNKDPKKVETGMDTAETASSPPQMQDAETWEEVNRA